MEIIRERLFFRIHHNQLFLLQKERAFEKKLLERIPDGRSLYFFISSNLMKNF